MSAIWILVHFSRDTVIWSQNYNFCCHISLLKTPDGTLHDQILGGILLSFALKFKNGVQKLVQLVTI